MIDMNTECYCGRPLHEHEGEMGHVFQSKKTYDALMVKPRECPLRCAQYVLVAWEPSRLLAFTFDATTNLCIAVPTGTTDEYLGKDLEHVYLAMASVMRYEDGTEPQPNTGHSANGYPDFILLTPARP